MDYETGLGIAMMFLGSLMTACLTLTVVKILHWIFEYEDRVERPFIRAAFKERNGI